jgi:hypothetical protein
MIKKWVHGPKLYVWTGFGLPPQYKSLLVHRVLQTCVNPIWMTQYKHQPMPLLRAALQYTSLAICPNQPSQTYRFFLIQSLKTFSPKYSIALVYQAFTNLQLKTCCKRRWQTLSEILGPKPKLWNIFAKAIALADKASNNTHLDKLDSSLLTAAD